MNLVPTTVQQNAIGLTLTVNVQENGAAIDLSGATTAQLVIKYPSGASATKTLTITGTLGQAIYVTQSNDLLELGKYQLQAYFVLPSGFNGRTEVGWLIVKANLT